MADFPDNLRPASFRGVPFLADSHAANEGRRSQEFEFYGRNLGVSEDLGAVSPNYAFDGFVIGADYMTKRDALRAALNKAGAGELIHPYLGRIWCVAKPFGLSETSSEGGLARFSLTFVAVAESRLPSEANDLPALARASADDVDKEAQALFGQEFSVASQPNWVFEEAEAVVNAAQDMIDGLAVGLSGFGAPLNDFITKGKALRGNILTLAASPLELSASISDVIKGLSLLASTPKDALFVLLSLTDFGKGLKPATGATPARLAQAKNQAAIVQLVAQGAAAQAVLAAADIEFTSYNEAILTRDQLADRLDDLALLAGDAGFDDVWRALCEARFASVRDINFRASDLAKIISYRLPITMPSLVLAHRLYGADDIEGREADLVARNGFGNPNFVTGGTVIEVLNG